MSRTQKQMILAGLKAGLPYLAMTHAEEREDSRKDTYICYAIAGAQAENKCSFAEYRAATGHIGLLLGHHVTAEYFLRDELEIPGELLTTENVQAYRKRWLESMIAEFS